MPVASKAGETKSPFLIVNFYHDISRTRSSLVFMRSIWIPPIVDKAGGRGDGVASGQRRAKINLGECRWCNF